MAHLHHGNVANRTPIDQLPVPSKQYIQSTKNQHQIQYTEMLMKTKKESHSLLY